MTKHFTLLLFIGLAFGENNSDLLIFKNGLQYHGKFLKIQNNMIYFKPKDSPDYQNVFTYQLDRVELKNGEVLNFKDVKKTNKTITKEIDENSTLVLKKEKQILEFDSGKRLIINNNITPIAAVSVGKVNGQIVDDLDYEMDSNADVDLNLVMNSSYEIIEIQGTGEKGTFSTIELNEMINLGKKCIEKIFKEQEKILNNND